MTSQARLAHIRDSCYDADQAPCCPHWQSDLDLIWWVFWYAFRIRYYLEKFGRKLKWFSLDHHTSNLEIRWILTLIQLISPTYVAAVTMILWLAGHSNSVKGQAFWFDLLNGFQRFTVQIHHCDHWYSMGIPWYPSTFPKIVVHDVLIGLSQRFVAGHATAAADSWGIRGTKARIMMQNDVDMFLSSRNQKFDVVLWCFMIFHVVTVVEANAGMLLWSSVYENSLTGHLAVDLSWAPCLRRSSFPSPFSFPNGIGTPKTSVPRLGHPMADQVNHLEIGNLSWFIMI